MSQATDVVGQCRFCGWMRRVPAEQFRRKFVLGEPEPK
jgi:hypothetical protein